MSEPTQDQGIARGQATDRTMGESPVPEDASQGIETYVEEKQGAGKGIMEMLAQVLAPKEKPGARFPSNPDIDVEHVLTTIGTIMADTVKQMAKAVHIAPSDQVVMLVTYANVTAREIVGRELNRNRITITNRHATDTLYLSHDANTATEDTGISVIAGESVTLNTRAAISAAYPVGGTQGRVELIIELDAP